MTQTKTCSKCHIEKELIEFHPQARGKYGVMASCKDCHAECQKANYQANRNERLEQQKAYNQANKDNISKRQKAWGQANKDKRAAYHKAYYKANKDKISKQHKAWQQANKESKKAYYQSYYQTPEGKAASKASDQNRRAYKLQNGGKHTAKELLALFDLQSGLCPYCKTKLKKTGDCLRYSLLNLVNYFEV